MKALFIDTSFWIAVIVQEALHEKALSWLAVLAQYNVVTTDEVLPETPFYQVWHYMQKDWIKNTALRIVHLCKP